MPDSDLRYAEYSAKIECDMVLSNQVNRKVSKSSHGHAAVWDELNFIYVTGITGKAKFNEDPLSQKTCLSQAICTLVTNDG
ncbi:hypothetical protein K420107F6_27480 [Lactonifactor longoviformis]